jgi:hypothetical protein
MKIGFGVEIFTISAEDPLMQMVERKLDPSSPREMRGRINGVVQA